MEMARARTPWTCWHMGTRDPVDANRMHALNRLADLSYIDFEDHPHRFEPWYAQVEGMTVQEATSLSLTAWATRLVDASEEERAELLRRNVANDATKAARGGLDLLAPLRASHLVHSLAQWWRDPSVADATRSRALALQLLIADRQEDSLLDALRDVVERPRDHPPRLRRRAIGALGRYGAQSDGVRLVKAIERVPDKADWRGDRREPCGA